MFKHNHEHTNEKNPLRFEMLQHWWGFHSTDGLNVSSCFFRKQLACNKNKTTNSFILEFKLYEIEREK